MSTPSLQATPLITAPMPLARVPAIHRAAALHNRGWSWTSVSLAMGEYHGQYLSAPAWRTAASYLGLETRKRPSTPASRAALARLHESRRIAA